MRFDTEHLQPELKVGLDAEEGFTECDVCGYVEDGIGGEMVELEPVEK